MIDPGEIRKTIDALGTALVTIPYRPLRTRLAETRREYVRALADYDAADDDDGVPTLVPAAVVEAGMYLFSRSRGRTRVLRVIGQGGVPSFQVQDESDGWTGYANVLSGSSPVVVVFERDEEPVGVLVDPTDEVNPLGQS